MSRRSRFWWAAWSAGSLACFGVLAWISSTALDLQRGEAGARAETAAQQRAHDAVWSMDSWMALLLSREAGRAWYEYSPYHEAQGSNYTTLLNAIPQGAIVVRSPLLTLESALLPLHFQLAADGIATSPQVPLGNLRDLAQATCVAAEVMDVRDARLALLAPLLDRAALLPRVARAEGELESEVVVPPAAEPTQRDWAQRAASVGNAQKNGVWLKEERQDGNLAAAAEDGVALIGPLVPLWLTDAEPPMLVYLRRVVRGESVLLQGFQVDWPALREELLAFGGDDVVALEPLLEDGVMPPAAARLVTIPAAVRAAPVPAAATAPGWTQLVIAVSWLVVLAAVLATGAALRGSVRWADSRSRFASAVTHELRTPLTSFRLYTDLLKSAQSEAERADYLDTLEGESARLSRLVENVLDYARLEDGRGPRAASTVGLDEVLERVEPQLAARCRESGADWTLLCDCPPGTALRAEEDGLARVLGNLVDNACKYGGGAVQLAVGAEAGEVLLRVCDDGAGLAPGQEEAVFRLFDRAGRDSSDRAPGIGLGLALARGLAAEWGGSLSYEPHSSGGACFTLRLPQA